MQCTSAQTTSPLRHEFPGGLAQLVAAAAHDPSDQGWAARTVAITKDRAMATLSARNADIYTDVDGTQRFDALYDAFRASSPA